MLHPVRFFRNDQMMDFNIRIFPGGQCETPFETLPSGYTQAIRLWLCPSF
jgi:hypothetical protein